jgi:hypothetical protein
MLPKSFEFSDCTPDLQKRSISCYLALVSTAEIINELPKLTESERRAIRQVLLDLANQDEDVALCNQAALEGAMMLDRMEDEDARPQSR